MGSIHVLNSQGDEVVEWDPADSDSCKKAKAEWDRLKKEGYEFFEPVQAKGKRLKRFDKKLGKVVAAPGVKTAEDKAAGTREAAMAGGPVDGLRVA